MFLPFSLINIHKLINFSFNKQQETLRIAQAIALAKFMEFFSDEVSFNEALMYGSFIVLSIWTCTIIDHVYFWNCARIGSQMQIALKGVIYDKVLRLRNGNVKDIEATLENMYSDDLSALERVIEFLPYFIIAPMQLAFVAYYLTEHVHPAFLAGSVLLLSFLPLQFISGKILKTFR